MKKSIVCLMALLMLLTFAAGCAGQPKTEPVDVDKAVSELKNRVPFDDPMMDINSETALTLYGLYGLQAEDVEEIGAALSTGATAEEIAVIQAVDGKLETCKQALEQRVEHQKASFENYVPAEIPKLEHACLMEKGNVVILCVAKDADTAKQAVQEILGA